MNTQPGYLFKKEGDASLKGNVPFFFVKPSIAIFGLACFMMILYGCGKRESGKPGTLEVLTGKTQLDAYKKMKIKIEGIDRSRREQIQEME